MQGNSLADSPDFTVRGWQVVLLSYAPGRRGLLNPEKSLNILLVALQKCKVLCMFPFQGSAM
jgi:hypothetical protein